jgi:IS605 OrfB family transposase
MIRSSKHKLISCNKVKLAWLDNLFIDYKKDLVTYINYIIEGVLPLKTNLSSSILPTETIKHSRYKQLVYKQASEIIRSQIDRASKKRYNNYKRIYSYMVNKHPESSFVKTKFSELNIKPILKSKYFSIPKLNNLSINLDERFFDIETGNHFDNFINIKLPYFNEKGTRALQINIPLNNHKHSNCLKKDGLILRKTIQIKNINGHYYINLIWFKEILTRYSGKSIGIDMGYKKLITSSDGQIVNGNLTDIYTKISKKRQGSKSFKKTLIHRDNEINRLCNELNLDNVYRIVIEDLNNVKHKKKYYTNKIQRWSYRKTIDKIARISEVKGIELVKVSPAYTSQTCSNCGHVDENSRNGEQFSCTCCGYQIDADYNAAVNIHNRGVYSPFNQPIHYFS